MFKEAAVERRHCKTVHLSVDLVVVGGGMGGTCCAITAAREGLKVVLVQDRPVLGGNASSEIRLWVLGATSHMGSNNRWAREGGVIDEILVENMYRNREGNAVLVDPLLIEKVSDEPNITLLLDTAAYEVQKADDGTDRITSVRAFCSQNSTAYELSAPLFCDASGDGILGFLAGAAFRMGAESPEEFKEGLAPDQSYGELLGHSLYFYSRDAGVPVTFVPPSFAIKNVEDKIPRFRQFNANSSGCQLWWIEYGGRLDTVHESQRIKWELWKVVYGVWDYIKNSGKFPDAATRTLEWVGMIPGKRESRRFEGDYMLTQADVIEQRAHEDAVAFGGWSIDLHPADGVYGDRPGSNHWHAKGTYGIPYRCLYSRNIPNLFLTGRIISVSHVAFGSTRVMGTGAHCGQAVGVAAAVCREKGLLPAQVSHGAELQLVQRRLLRRGQHIPGIALVDPENLAAGAAVSASSTLRLDQLPDDGTTIPLDADRAQMLPLRAGPAPRFSLSVNATADTVLRAELRLSSKPQNQTPDVTLATREIRVAAGNNHSIQLDFDAAIPADQFGFVCLMSNPAIAIHQSDRRLSGVLSLRHRYNQQEDRGVEPLEFWPPDRRPGGKNWAIQCDPPLATFEPQSILNGVDRPTNQPNVWVADLADPAPELVLTWTQPQRIARIALSFDVDFDHPMESVLMGHPESIMPFCVRNYRLLDDAGRVLAEVRDNHQALNTLHLAEPVVTRTLRLVVEHPMPQVPAAVAAVRCYRA
jgi:hypothetical protein